MHHDPSQDENPYASPDHSCNAGVDPSGQIHALTEPDDAIGTFIGVLYPIFVFGAILGILSLTTILVRLTVTGSGSLTSPVRAVLVLLTGVVSLIYFTRLFLNQVNAVGIDEDGIHLLRRFRQPVHLPWTEMTSIRPASRREVLWDGLLRPLLFPRVHTSYCALRGHYRIQGKTDYCFFPPKSPDVFAEAIAHYRPDLLEL